MKSISIVLSAAICGSAVARPGYLGSPVSMNHEIDPTVTIIGDFDGVGILWGDSYGVPWGSFLYEDPLPGWWEERLNRTVIAVAGWKLPVVLSLEMGAEAGRSCPARNASGTNYPTVNPFYGCSKCFDWNPISNPIASFIRQAYVNYVLFMVSAFNPIVINFGQDFNRFAEVCTPAQYASFVDFSNQIYDTVHNFHNNVSTYPSFSHESIMGVQDGMPCHGLGGGSSTPPPQLAGCISAGYKLLNGVKRDMLGLTVNPSSTQIGNGPWQLWYMSSVLDILTPQDAGAIAITSTGYLSTSLVVNFANDTTPPGPPVCTTLLSATVTDASDWFGYLFDLTNRYSITFLNFVTATDLLPVEVVSSCPCEVTDPSEQLWCDFLTLYRNVCAQAGLAAWGCEGSVKIGGAQGVRDYKGAPKQPLYSALQAARAATVDGPWKAMVGAAAEGAPPRVPENLPAAPLRRRAGVQQQ